MVSSEALTTLNIKKIIWAFGDDTVDQWILWGFFLIHFYFTYSSWRPQWDYYTISVVCFKELIK